MTKKQAIQLFEERKVRTMWDDEQEKWYFSIVDVCGVLTDSPNPRNYWKVLKHRLLKEGNQTVTNCNQLKLRAACDMYQVPVTSCADWTTLETESPCYYYFSCAEIEKATKSITIYMILAV